MLCLKKLRSLTKIYTIIRFKCDFILNKDVPVHLLMTVIARKQFIFTNLQLSDVLKLLQKLSQVSDIYLAYI